MFIILDDTSGNMIKYNNLLLWEVIPKTLRKLNYFWSDEIFFNKLQKLKIYYIDLLLAISSKKCLKFFLKKYNLTMKSSYLKYLCDDNIPLIIFNA